MGEQPCIVNPIESYAVIEHTDLLMIRTFRCTRVIGVLVVPGVKAKSEHAHRRGLLGFERGRMKNIGKLDRNKISFQTRQMLPGANHRLAFNRYLLSDRIISSVDGITFKSNPPVAG
jgi:hypothetical protein